MTQQFTASEVRDWERAYKGTGAAKVFGAFADLLEAQEKAVPLADFWAAVMKNNAGQWDVIHAYSAHDGNDGNDARTEMNDWINENNPKCFLKPLYLKAPPAYEERLAEALRAKIRRLRNMPKGEFQLAASIFADDLERILDAQSAQSAQAQPPATSVPDGFLRHVAAVCMGAVENCRPKASLIPEDPQEHNGGLCLNELTHIAGEIDRMLAAQAVPVMVVNHVSSAEHDLPIGMKLYTHPAPTERLFTQAEVKNMLIEAHRIARDATLRPFIAAAEDFAPEDCALPVAERVIAAQENPND